LQTPCTKPCYSPSKLCKTCPNISSEVDDALQKNNTPACIARVVPILFFFPRLPSIQLLAFFIQQLNSSCHTIARHAASQHALLIATSAATTGAAVGKRHQPGRRGAVPQRMPFETILIILIVVIAGAATAKGAAEKVRTCMEAAGPVLVWLCPGWPR
jgi:hypothetical protein